MGWWDRVFGKREETAVVREGDAVVVRNAEVAAALERPEQPHFDASPPGPCPSCGKDLAEVLLTTGGPLGDPEVWRDHPVAVDGWACVGCGVFRYPRRMSPDRIHEIGKEGAEHGQAGRVAEAELCFTRIAWDWPGYVPGHLNLAEATRDRIQLEKKRMGEGGQRARTPEEEARIHKLVERMLSEYERAIAGYEQKPSPELLPAVARAHLSVGQISLSRRALSRAERAAKACLSLQGLSEADSQAARQILDYVAERNDLFDDAAEVLLPYLHLDDREAKPIETGEDRKRVADAMDKLEDHLLSAPRSARGAWLFAKAKEALGAPDLLEVWRHAWAAHQTHAGIARDFSKLLLRRELSDEARRVNRTIVESHPDDAALWCNLAVTDLLCGDLAAAEKHLQTARELDPEDPIARAVEERLGAYRAGAPIPKTLRDLERG